jgi:hypothetical protein
MVSPSTILNPLPNAKEASQEKSVALVGQIFSTRAKAILGVPVAVVNTALFTLIITEPEVAVKLYHKSSLFSVLVQEGLGADFVAPVVLTKTAAEQLMPNGFTVKPMAPAHSLFGGGGGTS